MNDIFEMLKIVKALKNAPVQVHRAMMTDLEYKFLKRLDLIDQEEYEGLFKILNFLRFNDIYPTAQVEITRTRIHPSK